MPWKRIDDIKRSIIPFIIHDNRQFIKNGIEARSYLLTAGSAKNEIAKTEKQDATIFPNHVLGTVSPYPIVVTVI